jgi:hypothetical protein
VKFDRGHLVRRDDVAWGPSRKRKNTAIPTVSTGQTARPNTKDSTVTCSNTMGCGDNSRIT